jgi:hypothetical protein
MMKIKLVLAALITIVPMAAMAAEQNNIGTCGWGAKLFDGQSGIPQQVLAVTTNGTSGNQTFGISSGTSGCTQNGVVRSSWKTSMFIDGNKEKLAQDMSRGSGEALQSLAQLIGVKDADKAAFYRATKENFARIFTSDQATAEQVATGLKQVLAADSTLAQYSASI